MKKVLYAVFLVVVLFIPIKTKAISIDSVVMSGPSSVKEGEQATINLKANISNYSLNEGAWIVYTNINYSKGNLTLTSIDAPGYNTYIQYTTDGVEIVSQIKESTTNSDMCSNGVLSCGNYILNIKFQAINVTKTTDTKVSLSDFEVGTLVMDEDREYTIDDIIENMYSKTSEYIFKLEANTSTEEQPPASTVKETTPPAETVKEEQTTEKVPKPVVTKSDNNYLNNLEIENYKINFTKYIQDYNITIGSDVESLNITPSVDNEKASYKIDGNTSLKSGDAVKITVTAENGTSREYKININKEKAQIVSNETEEPKKEKEDFSKVNKNIIMIAGGIIGFIAVIGIIVLIVSIKDKRKLDKFLEEDEKKL